MIEVTAPSNIALIKYMGKSQVSGNKPTNGSLSFTLDGLVTKLKVSALDGSSDELRSLEGEHQVELSEKGKKRFLEFFAFLKSEFGIEGSCLIESGNNFPSDCGLASSASSFAALTKGAYAYARKQGVLKSELTLEDLSRLSQKGSGSSCRSFFTPFAIWESEGARAIDVGQQGWLHSVLILESQKKEVSSSAAHVQVLSSLLFQGRVERAELRLESLIEALCADEWEKAFELCWAEFWDMHALFETSVPSFGYMNGAALEALAVVRSFWKREGDGPLVTMDAGPNVHLLFRADQKEVRERLLSELKHKISSLEVLNS